jgi:hypothetical protein
MKLGCCRLPPLPRSIVRFGDRERTFRGAVFLLPLREKQLLTLVPEAQSIVPSEAFHGNREHKPVMWRHILTTISKSYSAIQEFP